MLRITVQLVSARGPMYDRTLGVCEIANDGTTSEATEGEKGSYNVKLSKFAPKLKETWKRGRVEGFDRVKRGPWDLLYLALKSCGMDKRNRGAKNED